METFILLHLQITILLYFIFIIQGLLKVYYLVHMSMFIHLTVNSLVVWRKGYRGIDEIEGQSIEVGYRTTGE